MNLSFDTRRPNLSSSLTPLGKNSPRRSGFFRKLIKTVIFLLLIAAAFASYLILAKDYKMIGELTLYCLNSSENAQSYNELVPTQNLQNNQTDLASIQNMLKNWKNYPEPQKTTVKVALGELSYNSYLGKDSQLIEAAHQKVLYSINPARILQEKLSDQKSTEATLWKSLSAQ